MNAHTVIALIFFSHTFSTHVCMRIHTPLCWQSWWHFTNLVLICFTNLTQLMNYSWIHIVCHYWQTNIDGEVKLVTTHIYHPRTPPFFFCKCCFCCYDTILFLLSCSKIYCPLIPPFLIVYVLIYPSLLFVMLYIPVISIGSTDCTTISTAGIPQLSSHQSPVQWIGVLSIDDQSATASSSPSSEKLSRGLTDPDWTGDEDSASIGLSFQLASLDLWGKILVFLIHLLRYLFSLVACTTSHLGGL